MKIFQRKARKASERDHKYQSIMRSLVRRYITSEQRIQERQRGVTEDDCNEIKQDISALRFELLEMLGGRNKGLKQISINLNQILYKCNNNRK